MPECEKEEKELGQRKRWQYRYFPNLRQYVVFCPYCDVNVNAMLDQVLEFQYCPYCGEKVDTSKSNT